MSRSTAWGWIYFLLGTVGILVWATATGTSINLRNDTSLWLGAATFLLLASFVLEPWYSGLGAAITNLLFVSVGTLAAGFGEYRYWWTLLLVLALGALAAIASVSIFDPPSSSTTRGVLLQYGQLLGSWRTTPLALLILTVLTFNPPRSSSWNITAISILYALLLSAARPERWLHSRLRFRSKLYVSAVIGIPSDVIVLGQLNELDLEIGALVRFSVNSNEEDAIVVGRAVAAGIVGWKTYCPGAQRLLATKPSEDNQSLVTLKIDLPSTTANAELCLVADALSRDGIELLGVAVENTEVADLEIELSRGASSEIGNVLLTHRDSETIYWQLTDATITLDSWPQDRQRLVRASANQLGTWDPVASRFRRITHTPAASDIVLQAISDNATEIALGDDSLHYEIGHMPRSNIPVGIDAAVLGRHHAAILGMTGTGKTHLSFALIEALVARGTRILCADLTGQYQARFNNAITLNHSGLRGFLGNPSAGDIAICDFTTASTSPVTQAAALIYGVYEHVKQLSRLNPVSPARFVVVLEEAHNFIPEGFIINDWGLKAEAQQISKVFMEARKFGLGFLVITQRTAMITKSALSQCGTMFAFQTVDKTSHDFFEGLCSRSQIRTFPNLPDRTTLAMGRSISSDVPLVMQVSDAAIAVN